MKQKRTLKIQRIRRTLFLAGLLFCLLQKENGQIVQAAPAALENGSEAVYENADESSARVGNLVQGNTFELLESITGADGSTWYRISTSSGISGYIKGSSAVKKIEAEEDQAAEEAQPQEDGEAAGDGLPAEEAAPEDALTPEGQEGNEDSENSENNADNAEQENQELQDADGQMDEGLSAAWPPQGVSREKTYAMQGEINRILTNEAKKIEKQPEEEQTFWNKLLARIDRSVVILVLVVIFAPVLIRLCYRRLLTTLSVSHEEAETPKRSFAEQRKARKRKKARIAKRRQAAKEAAKEAKKWKNSNLQK